MRLDHRHWTNGGTGVTNVSTGKVALHRAAIKAYATLTSDDSVQLSSSALDGTPSHYYSLHHTNRGSLSYYWRIYGALEAGDAEGRRAARLPDPALKIEWAAPRWAHVCNLPAGENCVGITQHKDNIYVATNRGVYMLIGSRLQPVPFEQRKDFVVIKVTMGPDFSVKFTQE